VRCDQDVNPSFYDIGFKLLDVSRATVERLAWLISDLRMGMEPIYVFSFAVGKKTTPGILPISAERIRQSRDLAVLKKVWQRIWTPATT
jgi:hypothetical protein